MTVFSTSDQLRETQAFLSKCLLLPFWDSRIPGEILESILAFVRGGEVLRTYDFVDVWDPHSRVGWQVKSTRANTPVTWKRAKLPDAQALIDESSQGPDGLQQLGDAIIAFCNDHARESIYKYELDEIGYSRLVLGNDEVATYFERRLCTKDAPDIFDPADYSWAWSIQRTTSSKEQLPAFHGTSRITGKKCWAWHGLGENQLHFNGESEWWPTAETDHSFKLKIPARAEKLSLEDFLGLIDNLQL